MSANPLLRVDRLRKAFGGLMAVSDLSFEIEHGQIKAMIGPNGSGKTTILNLISGVLPPTGGSIHFKGLGITGWKPDAVARRGIARTFQIVRLFRELTALENVMVGCHPWAPAGLLGAALALPRARQAEGRIREEAGAWLEYVGLGGRAQELAGNLPFGEQRLLELARALAAKPSLLLLDEPAAGLNDAERERLCALLLEVQRRGLTILLVEHNMDLVMNVSDEIVVINYGQKLAEGSPDQIKNQQEVIAAYLGDSRA
ncbi:MAG: ABC transporter ATP-binding protein [Dehalococcoidia bacterium]|nr:ABC transporter ATP-binding protein [Dehalococcoidia bacterium]